MAKPSIVFSPDLESVRVGDFLTLTLVDHDDTEDLFFTLEGPDGESQTRRVGFAKEGQFQVQRYGDYKASFVGVKNIASKKFSLKAPDDEA